MNSEDILSSLNEAQRQAVVATEGMVRIIAGAGSGKTKALTHRYAYLIEELGISPSNILCITFTNKAAKEMKNRVKKLLGGDFDTSFVSTLHSFCTRILREDISKLFYPESFIVLDPSDQKKILEEVYDELDIKMDTASFEFMILKIMGYKGKLEYCEYILAPNADISSLKPQNLEEEIMFKYILKQRKYFGLDFFDLINFVIYLFKNHEDVLEKWQNRLHYIMIDEFQDITNKEFNLMKSLTKINNNWFVVGDPDQNIYEWRGAIMAVLMDFHERMPGTQTIYLNENFRSTPEILNAANCLISKNKNRMEKSLYSKKPNGIPVEHYHAKNDVAEIDYVAEKIKEHLEKGGKYNDIAILYRANHVSRMVEQGLLKHNIPYMVYGGVGFYDRTEIKDVLSYLRLIEYVDDLSFLRIINVPRRKMGKNKLNYIKSKAAEEGLSLYECLKKYVNDSIFKGTDAKNFVEVIEDMRLNKDILAPSEILQKVLKDANYEMYIRESGDMDRLDNVSELARCIVQMERDYGEFLPLSNFLQDVALFRDTETEDNKDYVRIMTAHTAKGLEYPIIFIVGVNDGIMPSARAMEERTTDALEEERRLCFVGMTRAKQALYMTESEGLGFKNRVKVPSRFLYDIDDNLIERLGAIPEYVLEELKLQTMEKKFENVQQIFEVGTYVKHKVFGEGKIEEVNEKTKTYMVRFLNGIKPISFAYTGLIASV